MIAAVKKFHLFLPLGSEGILGQLQRLGLVEIHRLPDSFGFRHLPAEAAKVEADLKKVDFLKGLLESLPGGKPAGKISVSPEEEKEILERFPLDQLHAQYSALQAQLEKVDNRARKIAGLSAELAPFNKLDVTPHQLYQFKNFSFLVFTLAERLKENLKLLGDYPVQEIGQSRDQITYLLIFPREAEETVRATVLSLKVKILSLRPFRRKVAFLQEKLEKAAEKNQAQRQVLLEGLNRLQAWKNHLLVFSDCLKTRRRLVQAREQLEVSRFVQGFSGWILEKDIPALQGFLRANAAEHYLDVVAPEEGETIPVALENRPTVEPFEVVTDLYGRPVYTGLDPTGPLSIFFLIAFAFCLTDAGYGILIALLSWLGLKKFKGYPQITKFLRLMFYCGLATVVIGAVTGGWFGDLLNRTPGHWPIIRGLKKLVLLDPLESGKKSLLFLFIALAIGYFQIIWGLLLNAVHSVKNSGLKKSQEPLVALSIQLVLPVLFLAFLGVKKGLVAPWVFQSLLVWLGINFLHFMILKAVAQKGFLMRTFWAFYGLYGVLSGNLLGDPLSYSRLFGLGLTTSVLALAVNEMVFLTKGVPYVGLVIAGLVFLIGHAGNLAINLLGGYVHSSRLQYLEFFTKFFEAGGRPFAPFAEVREYTLVKR